MKNYKNNHHSRRNKYRNNGDRNYIRNGNGHKINTDFSNPSNFKRKNPGKNNQHASKLIEKYTILAKEALSSGDKILSENYFQHADHFVRVMGDKQKDKKMNTVNGNETNQISSENNLNDTELETKAENL